MTKEEYVDDFKQAVVHTLYKKKIVEKRKTNIGLLVFFKIPQKYTKAVYVIEISIRLLLEFQYSNLLHTFL